MKNKIKDKKWKIKINGRDERGDLAPSSLLIECKMQIQRTIKQTIFKPKCFINPFVQRNFAEKRGLKLVDPFSGHSLPNKEQKHTTKAVCSSWTKRPILGDPGEVSRIDKMFVVKVYSKLLPRTFYRPY